jgi:hypothetical protein
MPDMKPILAFSLLITVCIAASADGFREGQWEISTTMDLPGMPKLPEGVQLPPGVKLPTRNAGFTATQCLTRERAAPAANRSDLKCETVRQTFTGNTYEWTTHCIGTDGAVVDGDGKAIYSGDAMTSVFRMHGTDRGHPVDVTMNSTGKYLGACPN